MKASTLWLSAFLMDQHSHPYMATEKTIHHSTHLCWHCDVSASKCSVQFCQNFPSKKEASLNFVVLIVHSDYGTQEKKIYHHSHLFSIICYEMKGLDGMMLVFWMREWQSTPVFLPGELGGQRSLVGSYRVVHNWVMNTFRTLTSCQRVEWEPFWSSQSLPYQNFSVLNFLPYVSNRGKNFEISVCFQCTIYIFLSSMSPLKWTRFLDFLTFHLIFCFFSPSTILHIAITAVFPDNSYTITLLQI